MVFYAIPYITYAGSLPIYQPATSNSIYLTMNRVKISVSTYLSQTDLISGSIPNMQLNQTVTIYINWTVIDPRQCITE